VITNEIIFSPYYLRIGSKSVFSLRKNSLSKMIFIKNDVYCVEAIKFYLPVRKKISSLDPKYIINVTPLYCRIKASFRAALSKLRNPGA